MIGYTFCEMFCIYCCPPTVTNITNTLAFVPHEPTYRFETDNTNKDNVRLVLTERSLHWNYGCCRPLDDYDAYYVRTDRGNRIACLYIRATDSPRFTILYSHRNAEDLGHSPEFLLDLGYHNKCNILTYDYSGYGASSGHPSEANIYSDVVAAFSSLKTRYNIDDQSIVLYGVSIGCVPTIDLAAKYQVRGVIIQAAFMSGIRLVLPKFKKSYSFDPFPNVDKISKVMSPVLVIHGTDDTTVDICHGKGLYKQCKRPVSPLWVEKAGHNDLELFPELSHRLSHFLKVEL